MSYASDFAAGDGWSVADVGVRLDTGKGKIFLDHLRAQGVDTLIRYYASTPRPKTLTPQEARFLSSEGFGILPVFQDSSRKISDFSSASGVANARSAVDFAQQVGQPADGGSTIFFAVDQDYNASEIDGPICDYFQAVAATTGGAFKIGAYGSGAVLAKLLDAQLISVPWLSMSRLFMGTEPFFYGKKWWLRQVPPSETHAASGVGYDRDVVRVDRKALGAFTVDAAGQGSLAWREAEDATLGGGSIAVVPQAAVQDARLVSTDGLRLRASPNGTVLRELMIGEVVQDLGDATQAGWRNVRAGKVNGAVFGRYLREAQRPEVEALVRCVLDEWIRFEKGHGNEKVDPYCGHVREMWAALGEPWDGRSHYSDGTEVPWSAAFISWVVRKAGAAYANFQFAASHSIFVNNAIKARMTERQDKPFWGYRISEQQPALGDIVQRNREGGSLSFSYAENHTQYASHSDVVVEVTPDVVRVIGGNVGNTVSMTEYHLDASGFLRPDQRLISLLKNRAGLARPHG